MVAGQSWVRAFMPVVSVTCLRGTSGIGAQRCLPPRLPQVQPLTPRLHHRPQQRVPASGTRPMGISEPPRRSLRPRHHPPTSQPTQPRPYHRHKRLQEEALAVVTVVAERTAAVVGSGQPPLVLALTVVASTVEVECQSSSRRVKAAWEVSARAHFWVSASERRRGDGIAVARHP